MAIIIIPHILYTVSRLTLDNEYGISGRLNLNVVQRHTVNIYVVVSKLQLFFYSITEKNRRCV